MGADVPSTRGHLEALSVVSDRMTTESSRGNGAGADSTGRNEERPAPHSWGNRALRFSLRARSGGAEPIRPRSTPLAGASRGA